MESRTVTLINKKTYRVFAVSLIGKGRKYYKITHRYSSESEMVKPWKIPIGDYILLEGERQDVVERVREAVRDQDRAKQEHYRDREAALYVFRLVWDREHPFPVLPPLEELLKEFERKGGEE